VVTNTEPRKPAAGFPAASTAVIVMGIADPEVVEAGVATRKPTAPARLAALSFGVHHNGDASAAHVGEIDRAVAVEVAMLRAAFELARRRGEILGREE